MSSKKRFSKDPKVQLSSIDDFFWFSDFNLTKRDLWLDTTTPKPYKSYFKFTPNYLIRVMYNTVLTGYGTKTKPNLYFIDVAYRDGTAEYELFDKVLDELKEEKEKHKRSKKLDEEIATVERAKKRITKMYPPYAEYVEPAPKPFETYLSDTGYKTTKDDLKNKYLVFDVETNGLRKANDDLLSLSIYDPTSGVCYNRFFPLDLQPLILTGNIHGITDETLAGASHMTQEEYDWLNDYFHLEDRILLSYSGGKGEFDSAFVQNYCKRHGIVGFENLQFENIKSRIPKAPFGSEGKLSKDNLCNMFGIEGVSDIHSSYNDCILEWKLFENLESECVFFINYELYRCTPEYIIPVSYLLKYPELAKYAGIHVPNVQGKATELFKLEFPKSLIKQVKKFSTNITGMTIEHGINTFLNAKKQDNMLFLAENRSHLKFVGSLCSYIRDIPVHFETDGTVKAVEEEDRKFIEEVNEVTRTIIEQIKPLADYLKENIFIEDEIMTQELSITDDRKVLALCDLSDGKNVVEIKTNEVLEDEKNSKSPIIKDRLAKQLYYQAKGRNTFVLSVLFDTHFNMRSFSPIVDGLTIHLYKVDLSIDEDTQVE